MRLLFSDCFHDHKPSLFLPDNGFPPLIHFFNTFDDVSQSDELKSAYLFFFLELDKFDIQFFGSDPNAMFILTPYSVSIVYSKG